MWNCVYEQRNRYRREAETRQDATSTRRITPSRSVVAAREGISGVFRGSLKARGLRLVARSAGGPTFCQLPTDGGRCLDCDDVSSLAHIIIIR